MNWLEIFGIFGIIFISIILIVIIFKFLGIIELNTNINIETIDKETSILRKQLKELEELEKQ